MGQRYNSIEIHRCEPLIAYYCHADTNNSNYFHEKWAVTAVCLRTMEKIVQPTNNLLNNFLFQVNKYIEPILE